MFVYLQSGQQPLPRDPRHYLGAASSSPGNPLLGFIPFRDFARWCPSWSTMSRSVFTEAYIRFRRLLIEARRSARLTQAQLAERLGRPQSFVSKYETGERRLDVVEFLELAQVLGIDPVELLREVQKSIPPSNRPT
jgi:DNA-binding XRE family transcriptional regulator